MPNLVFSVLELCVGGHFILDLVWGKLSRSWHVLICFDRVGTVGMERDYSWSFVPFRAVCVRSEFPGNRATDPNRRKTQLTLAAGPRSSTRRQGYRHVGSECSWHREWFCMQIYRKASLRAGGASHPSRTCGRSLEVVISPSRLDDDPWHSYDICSTNFPKLYRQSLVRRPVFSLVGLLVRPWPYRLAPAAGESCVAHKFPIPCSLCHLMYTQYDTLMVLL